jgi:S1-C subfamily serine protease
MIMGLSGEMLGRLGIDPKKGVTYAMLEDNMNAFTSETESVIDLITPGKQLAEGVIAAWNKGLEKGKRPVGVAKIIPPSGIGMGLFTLTREIASDMHLEQDTRGVLVIKVYARSIAEKAGFKVGTTPKDFSNMQGTLGGDVIIGVENKLINTVEDFLEYFEYYHEKGTKIRFKVLRGGKPIEIALVY